MKKHYRISIRLMYAKPKLFSELSNPSMKNKKMRIKKWRKTIKWILKNNNKKNLKK